MTGADRTALDASFAARWTLFKWARLVFGESWHYFAWEALALVKKLGPGVTGLKVADDDPSSRVVSNQIIELPTPRDRALAAAFVKRLRAAAALALLDEEPFVNALAGYDDFSPASFPITPG